MLLVQGLGFEIGFRSEPKTQLVYTMHMCSAVVMLSLFLQVSPSGALLRTFKYIYSTTERFTGSVRSIVIQQQQLRLYKDGRLTLDMLQSMPDLPYSMFGALGAW
jgi:hypothetical protein